MHIFWSLAGIFQFGRKNLYFHLLFCSLNVRPFRELKSSNFFNVSLVFGKINLSYFFELNIVCLRLYDKWAKSLWWQIISYCLIQLSCFFFFFKNACLLTFLCLHKVNYDKHSKRFLSKKQCVVNLGRTQDRRSQKGWSNHSKDGGGWRGIQATTLINLFASYQTEVLH